MFTSKWMRPLQSAFLPLLVCGLAQAQGANEPPVARWQLVTGAENLHAFMSGRILLLQEGKDSQRRGEYRADGSGTLYAWGGEFVRRWEIRGDDQICVTGFRLSGCYQLEKSTIEPLLFRVTDVDTGQVSEIREDPQGATVIASSGATDTDRGGAAAPSADELAAKLANPTAPVMTIGNNFDYVSFDGDLPGASDQSSFRYVFQTVFPFTLSDGGTLFFRPAIPVMFNEPIPAGGDGWQEVGTDFADMGFDLSYGKTTTSGLLWGIGMAGTIPIATDDRLGKDLWGLGPELLLGKMGKWGVVGGLISHQWDIAGSGKGEIDLTSINYFYAFPLGGGWQVAAGPSMTYDHTRPSGDRWTIPAGIGISKTSVISGRPWKFQLQYWNYLEAPDGFAAEHQVRLSVSPVVSAPWNDGN